MTSLRAVQEAEAAAETQMVKLVTDAAKTDANHAWRWLERKHPARWGSQARELRELARTVAELEKAIRAHGITLPPAEGSQS